MLLEPAFSHDAFDAGDLAHLKQAAGLRISVCLPARDEAATVGTIVERVRRDLVEVVPLVDEVVVVDDGSTDATRAVARAAGAVVFEAANILSEVDPGSGKGDVLWKSLHVTDGDLICWLDADLEDFSSHFVTGLLGPLITRPTVEFVKGFYDRPLDAPTAQGGGRVTELVARPLISKLFPHLSSVIQPLGGEYAGRRSLLEQLPFTEGWGVELGLLVDIASRCSARSVAQVDLGVRRHRSRPLAELGTQAMAILATALRKAGVDDDPSWGDDLVQVLGGRLTRVGVETRERPPIATIAAYRSRHSGNREARERTA